MRTLEQVSDDREQSGLAGTVRPQQDCKIAGTDREADLVQSKPLSIAESEIVDFERRVANGGVHRMTV
jgi:hypothetical protein